MAQVTLKYGDIWEDLIKSHEPLRTENHSQPGSRREKQRESKQERVSAHYSCFEMGVIT